MTITTLAAHDTLFSFGENLGASDCDTPIERFRWLPTRQPVLIDMWNNPDGGAKLTRPSPPGITKARTSPIAATPITGRRIVSLKNSSTCRAAGQCPSSWPPVLTKMSRGGCAITAGDRRIRWKYRRTLIAIAVISKTRAESSPSRAISTCGRTPAGSATAAPAIWPLAAGDHAGDRLQQVPADGQRTLRLQNYG